MEKITKKGKEWFCINDFMKKYGIRSNKTVYNKVKKKEILTDKFMGKRIFSIK